MKRKIIGVTVGTPMKPQAVIEKTTQAWTEEEKARARELLGAVGNDDYATQDVGGVVKVKEVYGTRVVAGVLDLMPAQYSLIDSRSPNEYPLYLVTNATRHMIVPANIDYAVKKVLSTDKLAGTAQAWTDEEKASARALLGIESSGGSGVPSHDASNEGQFLRIVDGSPAWVTIEDGDEVAY